MTTSKRVLLSRPLVKRDYPLPEVEAVTPVNKNEPGRIGGGFCTPSIEGGTTKPIPHLQSQRVEEAKAILGKCTKPELKELYDHLAFLVMEHDAGQSRDLDMWAAEVYAAMADAIGTAGAGMPGPLAVKSVLRGRTAWGPVYDFAAAVGVLDMKVAERKSCFRFLARLLVARCREVAQHVHAPLTAKMVANNCGDIAAIFDVNFPGYAASGVAGFLFKRLASGEHVT
jgi:hypothetical protein